MILYHGSDIVVKVPQLVIQKRMLDFGPGFYTTTNLDQAINFAGLEKLYFVESMTIKG